MYHIKDDARAVKSAEFLYEGLKRCMEKEEFDKITVRMLCEEAIVGRTTFYRNFDAVIDVLYWKCDQLFRDVMSDYFRRDPNLTQTEQFPIFILKFWMHQDDVLDVLITHGRSDIIFNIFLNNAEEITEMVNDKVRLPQLDNKYFISTRVGMFVGIFQTWVMGGKKESAEEIIAILQDQRALADRTGFMF